MNINQVRYFVLVHDCRSFSAAAKQRGISVQAVSKAVGELEDEIGIELLERSSRGVIPTAAGKAFYQRARVAVSAFDNLENFKLEDIESTPTGPLRIALYAPPFEHSAALLKIFTGYIKREAGVDVNLSLADINAAESNLLSGVYDALLTIGTYTSKKTECCSFGTLPTGIRVFDTHPLADKEFVTAEDLKAYPAGESEVIDAFNNSILSSYRKAGLLGKTEKIPSVSEDSRRFMNEENGYYFSAVFPQMASPKAKLRLIPVDPAIAIQIPICIVTLEGHMTPDLEKVRQFMLKMSASLHK